MDRPRTKQDLVIRMVGQQHEAAATGQVSNSSFAHVVQHPDPLHTMLHYLVQNPVNEMLEK